MKELDAFTQAYIDCALWASTDQTDESGGDPLDANYGPDDLAPETLASILEDCAAFQRDNARDLEPYDAGRAGHDFWLTRNRHGAGFWDGDYSEDVGRRLTDAAHAYGECDLLVGDDGRLYL